MLLEYGIATIATIVAFSVADRLTQAGILAIFATYSWIIFTVFPA